MNLPQKNVNWFTAFKVYHAENPQVYILFDKFARVALAAGFTHYSTVLIMAQVRWHTQVVTRDLTFKINQNYAAYYGRLFMAHNHKDSLLHDFFKRRVLTIGLTEEELEAEMLKLKLPVQ